MPLKSIHRCSTACCAPARWNTPLPGTCIDLAARARRVSDQPPWTMRARYVAMASGDIDNFPRDVAGELVDWFDASRS
ncbi:hypothetical protein KCP74_08855 [Salmonella enterica subsp. enterica]|nr:hypothetical protein KCP74_08855 [Salmonella enterica subsp. enterica]